MNQQRHADHQKPTTSPAGRSFLTRTLARRDVGGSYETNRDAKGPFGLSTLSDPPEAAIADLIFVHGLGGGSRSTWTKDLDPALFWPQEWLPQDTGFRDVRIHCFGYDSNWKEESILNIHDFAKSLLGSIQDCPVIPQGSGAPLVFVGHSMGGLVIKKAFILAQQLQDFGTIAQRVRAMYFLATPHRGADLATLLTKILHITTGARPFVQDLHRNSLATQSINDEFPQHCQNIQLYSFYETLPMSYGIGKCLVVDKDLAVLGYPNERTAYVNANHREICKFSTPTDPNYLTIRNALASTIDSFRNTDTLSKRQYDKEKRFLLDSFLAIYDAPEDDLMGVDARRMKGSCEWLTERESFRVWHDSTDAQLYWVSAKPATGKSVLSGFIVNYLRDLKRECSFYFFDYSNKLKATISYFLRSMAWQMAVMHPEVLQTVLEISEKDNQLAKADYRSLWRKLFVDGILRVKLGKPQYWVIDALDECKGDSELVPLLVKVLEMCQIRIVVTSRNKFESHSLMSHLKIKVVSEEILEDDTRRDISLYLEANMGCLPSVDEETQQSMVAKILTKSAGCFLWVDLVLQELRQVHTSAEIVQVLEDVPSDMNELYLRILDSMAIAPYGKLLAKAILTWTVCSARPLTTEELYYALQLDIKDNIDKIERSIAACCGQLVYVDSQSRVHMVHQTARDFLLRHSMNSEFAIDKSIGHQRLAMACIEYLSGEEMKAPRQRKLSVSNVVKRRCAFANYACSSLYEHIAHVSSTDDEFLTALAKFLISSNVLSWIEFLAQHSDLRCIIQTGKSFKKYLLRRSRYMSPFGKSVAILDTWATDLVRLVAKFGQNLSTSPNSIFHLIPPFCPAESAPRKQFAASTRGITVLGLSATTWDDCLSTIAHPREQMTALACSDRHFAIGLSTGEIVVYHEMTCQEAQVLQHQEPVRILQFGQTAKLIASGGMKVVRLWDVTSWQQLWRLDVSQECMLLQFTDEDRILLGALRSNYLMIWDLTTGALIDSANWTQDLEGESTHSFRRPITAAICVESSLLAVVYRGQDILLWNIEENALQETYNKETGAQPGTRHVKNMVTGGLVFSQDPSAHLLAASYSDGDLVLFDTLEGAVREKTLANAQTLASSPDGRTLASADSAGTIQLFDFETLKLLYRINSDEYGIKALAFNKNSQRLLDIRGSECRVWDPAVLLRQDVDEETSDAVSISTAPQEVMLESCEDVVLITSLACHDRGEVLFCGKDDGSVYLYETRTGSQSQKLLSHASGVCVVSLYFDYESHILTSIDSSSRVIAHKLNHQYGAWKAVKTAFDVRAGVAVDQVLGNRGYTKMLVCSAEKVILYSVTTDGSAPLEIISLEKHRPSRWRTHPSNPSQLISISDNVAHLYDWETLRRLTGTEGILLKSSILPELSIQYITPCVNNSLIATAFGESLRSNSTSRLLLWKTSDFSMESSSTVPVPRYESLVDQVQLLIGTYGRRLVFLHRSGWVCSADPEMNIADHPVRHFFIPGDWLSVGVQLMIDLTCNGDIVFVKRHEIAVIKRGLETSEQDPSEAGKRTSFTAKRPSFTGTRSQGSGEIPLRPYEMGKRPSLPGSRSPGSGEIPLRSYGIGKRPSLPGSRSPGSDEIFID